MIKTLFQYWDTINIDPRLTPNIKSMENIVSSESYVLYNRDTASEYIRDNMSPEVCEYFENFHDTLPAARSDMFRIVRCLVDGGSYWDTSHRIIHSNLKKIKQLFIAPEYDITLVCKINARGKFRISNSPLISTPRNIHISTIWRNVCVNIEKRKHNNVWSCTGPGVIQHYISSLIGYPSDTDWKQNLLFYIDKLKVDHSINLVCREDIIKYIKIYPITRGGTHWSKQQKKLGTIYR